MTKISELKKKSNKYENSYVSILFCQKIIILYKMSKIGLILCHNLNDEPQYDLPQNVIWDHVKDFTTLTKKYDYVVDQNCNDEEVDYFLSKPGNYLKPNGQFIHLNGVDDALLDLNLDRNAYLQKDKATIETLSNYVQRLTKEYGFVRWSIPAANNSLTTDIYYTLGLPESPFPQRSPLPKRSSLPQRSPLPPSSPPPHSSDRTRQQTGLQKQRIEEQEFQRRKELIKKEFQKVQTPEYQGLAFVETLSDDEIYVIVKEIDITTLINLCQTNRRISDLCKTPRFTQIFEEYLYKLIPQKDYKEVMKVCNSHPIFRNICKSENFINFYTDNWQKRYSTPERALIAAAREGALLIVDRLIQYGINPATNNSQALITAIYSNHPDVVQRLLQDPNIDASVNNNSALEEAISIGNLGIVDILLTHGNGTFQSKPLNIDILKKNAVPLENALILNRPQIIQRLLNDPIIGTFIPPLLPKYKNDILKYNSQYKRNLLKSPPPKRTPSPPSPRTPSPRTPSPPMQSAKKIDEASLIPLSKLLPQTPSIQPIQQIPRMAQTQKTPGKSFVLPQLKSDRNNQSKIKQNNVSF